MVIGFYKKNKNKGVLVSWVALFAQRHYVALKESFLQKNFREESQYPCCSPSDKNRHMEFWSEMFWRWQLPS